MTRCAAMPKRKGKAASPAPAGRPAWLTELVDKKLETTEDNLNSLVHFIFLYLLEMYCVEENGGKWDMMFLLPDVKDDIWGQVESFLSKDNFAADVPEDDCLPVIKEISEILGVEPPPLSFYEEKQKRHHPSAQRWRSEIISRIQEMPAQKGRCGW